MKSVEREDFILTDMYKIGTTCGKPIKIEKFVKMYKDYFEIDIDDEDTEKLINKYKLIFGDNVIVKSVPNEKWRYYGQCWLQFNFKDLERFKPYIGLQIYPYFIDIEEIFKGEEKVKEKSEPKNVFPYDYEESDYYYQVGKNMDIDITTGNIIKKEDTNNKIQIWFCQEGIGHIGIQYDGCDKEKGDKNLIEFRKEIKKTKMKKYNYIIDYYQNLLNDKLVYDEIVFANEYDKIEKAIAEMLDRW